MQFHDCILSSDFLEIGLPGIAGGLLPSPNKHLFCLFWGSLCVVFCLVPPAAQTLPLCQICITFQSTVAPLSNVFLLEYKTWKTHGLSSFSSCAMTADWDLPAHPSFLVSSEPQQFRGGHSRGLEPEVKKAAELLQARRGSAVDPADLDPGGWQRTWARGMWFNDVEDMNVQWTSMTLWDNIGIILYYIGIICSMCYVQCNHLIWLYDHYWHLIHLISSHVPQPGRTFALRATWPLLRSCLVAVRRTAKPHNNRFTESKVELHLDLSNCYWANNLKNLEHPLSSLIELFFTGSGWAWTLLRMRVWKWKWLRSPVTQGLTM